jgi:hypothetical protein
MSGFQIPGPTRVKVDYLIATHGAVLLPAAPEFALIAEDKAMICVVDTVTYETATYCFSGLEFVRLNDSADFRPRVWLLMDRAKARELAKFPQLEAERPIFTEERPKEPDPA